MPLNIEELKKRHGQSATSKPKKPPLVPPSTEPFFEDVQKEPTSPEKEKRLRVEEEESRVKKRDLINQLFDENKDLPLEKMLAEHFFNMEEEETKGGKKVGKTTSPLKGIREGMEDILNIQQLYDLIRGFRNMRKKPDKEEESEEEGTGFDNNILQMLPFLQRLQSGGLDASKIDPLMLYLSMANTNQKSNQGLGQLFMMMSMFNMFGNQQQPVQKAPDGTPVQNQAVPSMEWFKAMYDELRNIMNQPKQPQVDPITLMLMQSINKANQNQGGKADRSIEILLDKMNTMMQNNQAQQFNMAMQTMSDKWERSMEVIASALHGEKPEDKLMRNFAFFREIAGDKRERSKDEMDYDLKKKEIELQEYARRDMLDREERQAAREDAKGARIMETASTVLDKVVGNGLGHFVKDIMSARQTNTGGRRGRAPTPETEDFDASLLDDL